MASSSSSSSSSTFAISSSSTLLDSKAPRQSAAPSSNVPLPTLPSTPTPTQIRPWKSAAYCRKAARNVMAMATREVATGELAELPEIIRKVQEVSGFVALWASAGVVPSIDSLPLIPGLLELWALANLRTLVDMQISLS